MLQVLLAPLSYNAGVVSRSSVAGQRSAAPLMVKSESLPFMEEPAHLSGMVGNVGFDPMGLSTPQNIKWMREAELKHGRICMLAWVGWVAVDLGVKFPGAKYAALSSYQAAVIKENVPLLKQAVGYEMLLLFLWVGAAVRSMSATLCREVPRGTTTAEALLRTPRSHPSPSPGRMLAFWPGHGAFLGGTTRHLRDHRLHANLQHDGRRRQGAGRLWLRSPRPAPRQRGAVQDRGADTRPGGDARLLRRCHAERPARRLWLWQGAPRPPHLSAPKSSPLTLEPPYPPAPFAGDLPVLLSMLGKPASLATNRKRGRPGATRAGPGGCGGPVPTARAVARKDPVSRETDSCRGAGFVHCFLLWLFLQWIWRSVPASVMLTTTLLSHGLLVGPPARPSVRRACGISAAVAAPPEAPSRKVLWEPKEEVMEQTAMRCFQREVGVDGSYEELWKWSVENSDEFWTRLLDFVEVEYSGETVPAKQGDLMPDVTYFPNVELNFAENMLRHGAPGSPLADAEAVVSVSEAREDRRWSFSELRDDASRVRAALDALGVRSSDACGAYIANLGETVVAMLGATSLGATWTSCSPDFGAQAVADRFGQAPYTPPELRILRPTPAQGFRKLARDHNGRPPWTTAGGAEGTLYVRRLRLRGQDHLDRRQDRGARRGAAVARARGGGGHDRRDAGVERAAGLARRGLGRLPRLGFRRRWRCAAADLHARPVCPPPVRALLVGHHGHAQEHRARLRQPARASNLPLPLPLHLLRVLARTLALCR